MKKALFLTLFFVAVFGFNVSPVSAGAGEIVEVVAEGNIVEFPKSANLSGIFIRRGDTFVSLANPETMIAMGYGRVDIHGKIKADWNQVIKLNEVQTNFIREKLRIAGQTIKSNPPNIPIDEIQVCDDINTYRSLKLDYDSDDNRRLVLRWNYGYTDLVNDFHVMVSINNGKFVYLGQTGNADEYFVFSSENQKGSELLKQGPQFSVRYTFKVVALRKWSLPNQTMNATTSIDYQNMNPSPPKPESKPITPPKVSVKLSGYEKQMGQVYYVLSGIPIDIGIEIKSDVAVSGKIKWGDDTLVGLGGKGKDGVLSGNYSHKYYVIAGHSGNYVISYSVNGGEDVEIAQIRVIFPIPSPTPTSIQKPSPTPTEKPSPTQKPSPTLTPSPISTPELPYIELTLSTYGDNSRQISSRIINGATTIDPPVFEVGYVEGDSRAEEISFRATAYTASEEILITGMAITHTDTWNREIQVRYQNRAEIQQDRAYKAEVMIFNVTFSATLNNGEVWEARAVVKVVDNTPPPTPTPTVTPVPPDLPEPEGALALMTGFNSWEFAGGTPIRNDDDSDYLGVQFFIPEGNKPWDYRVMKRLEVSAKELIQQGKRYRVKFEAETDSSIYVIARISDISNNATITHTKVNYIDIPFSPNVEVTEDGEYFVEMECDSNLVDSQRPIVVSLWIDNQNGAANVAIKNIQLEEVIE